MDLTGLWEKGWPSWLSAGSPYRRSCDSDDGAMAREGDDSWPDAESGRSPVIERASKWVLNYFHQSQLAAHRPIVDPSLREG